MPGELEFLENERQDMVYKSPQVLGSSVEPGLIKWLTDHKVVRNKVVAGRLLVVASILFFILALGFASDWRFFVIPNNPKVGEGVKADLGDGRGFREIPPDTRISELIPKNIPKQ